MRNEKEIFVLYIMTDYFKGYKTKDKYLIKDLYHNLKIVKTLNSKIVDFSFYVYKFKV